MEDTTMKKTYINPEMEVVKIATQQMLAASAHIDIDADPISGGDAVAREGEYDF